MNCLLFSALTGVMVYYYIQCIILSKLISDSSFTYCYLVFSQENLRMIITGESSKLDCSNF